MATENPVESLQDEATCTICLEYFKEPVSIHCGHNFCRACITQCWGKSDTNFSCPQCRETAQQTCFRPNRELANVVEIIKRLRLQSAKGAEGEKMCETHGEALKLFCEEDQTPICVVCDRSRPHRAHTVVPIEEAAQEYKEKMEACLVTLKKERGKLLEFKLTGQERSQKYLKLTNTVKGSIMCEFEQLHQCLEEQERLLLARLADLDTEIAKSQNDNVTKLSEELPHLDMLISELEGKHQQPASEFLQDIRNTLSRCEKRKFQNLEEITSELGKRLNSVFQQNNALKETLKKFKETLSSKVRKILFQSLRPDEKANVTLDPDTAHPCLVLSEDQKSVTWGDRRQKLLSSPKRFDSSRCVLGSEGFTSGKHYWEVELQVVGGMFAKLRAEMSEGYWVVGVARESVRRKGVITLNPEEGVWAVRKQKGQYTALTCPEILLSLSSIFRRIRVSLDYEGGQVAFVSAEDETPLFTFPPACFLGERICPFFCVEGQGTRLRLCP